LSESYYVSERDFVSNFLLPKLKKSVASLGFSDVLDLHVENPVQGGVSDLTIHRGGKGLLVIEAKFKKKTGKKEVDIEPRDPDVINQAINYAVNGGFKFYGTCNTKRLVLYQLIPGKKPYECEVASFDFKKYGQWHEDCIKCALGLMKITLKQVDDTLIETLHEAYQDLYPEFFNSLKNKLKDKQFKKKYVEWLSNQGIEFIEEKNRLIASQTTYLQINKLLFYKVIRTIYPERLPKLKIREGEDVSQTLKKFYSKIKTIDYQPVYENDLISEIPLTSRAKERFITLTDTLLDFDFSTMESDFLGAIYEKLIPPSERKRLGQFYTPPPIVDFILGLTLNKKDDVLLDPACGSGTFLVKAYHKLRKLNSIPKNSSGNSAEIFHKQLLNQIYGIDINQFPAHLSVINLAIQKPKAKVDRINVVVKDAFDIIAGQTTLFGFQSISTEGKSQELEIPPNFDVIVANPPYIRQELLGSNEKKKIKERIENDFSNKLFVGRPNKLPRDAIILSKQSDIYVYFFIQALKLLKENGKLGFICSNKWLEVGYGESFQQFLLDHCKILYVVEFDRSIFPDADVNTSIVILEKETNKEKHDKNVVKFVRFKRKITVDSMHKFLKTTKESLENETVRIKVIEQNKLKKGRWNIYLRAPSVFHKIIEDSKITCLNSVADIHYGIKTGYNAYFVLSNEQVEDNQIETKYLKPCISTPKDLEGLILTREQIKNHILMIYDDKYYLKGTNALNYIKYGERLEVEVTRGANKGKKSLTELESIQGHNPFWYCMPKLPIAPILFQYLIGVKGIATWNKIEAHATDVFHYVIPHAKDHVLPLLGFLNSSFSSLGVELYGRSYGGGILKIQAYELRDLPVIDPSKISLLEREKISNRFKNLANAIEEKFKIKNHLSQLKSRSKKNKVLSKKALEKKLKEAINKEKQAQNELDEVIFDALKLSRKNRSEVMNGLKELQMIRELRKQD